MVFRFSLPLLLLALSGEGLAVGLGELRGQPSLGDRLQVDIELLGTEKQSIEPACFRLIKPADTDDLPWLKQAALSVRKGVPQVLEIRSPMPLREPVIQIAVHLACGHEVSRQYVLLASPSRDRATAIDEHPATAATNLPAARSAPPAYRPRALPAERSEVPSRLTPRRVDRRLAPSGLPDRLMLSGGGDVGEPSLRLATELSTLNAGMLKEAQRDILRLEYRMLIALNEQASTQLATAEKLRNMEATLGELQQHAADFAGRVEKGAAPASTPEPRVEAPTIQVRKAPAPDPQLASDGFDPRIYGVALGALLGLAAWLFWRKRSERHGDHIDAVLPIPDSKAAAYSGHEGHPGNSGVDLSLEENQSSGRSTMHVDVELDAGEQKAVGASGASDGKEPLAQDSFMTMNATTLDEHFEANPVMELADIMLSFGRVKGAAQALQEYIDNSPQEALQPWIRLMEVYRMAGMREEFEAVARNLNQHFNVEIQHWDGGTHAAQARVADPAHDDAAPVPVAPRPESLEDMPRIMTMVCDLWPSGDVVGCLYQLLRDNRGGKRLGFALPVVEEILFLIELKETSNRIH